VTASGRGNEAEPPPLDDPEDSDDLEDFEDEEEDEGEEPERRSSLSVMLALVIGVWIGRAFYRLPDGLENLAGLALSLATALILVGIYRRWVRRQFAEARARRLRRR
jgi:hypothetical protein